MDLAFIGEGGEFITPQHLEQARSVSRAERDWSPTKDPRLSTVILEHLFGERVEACAWTSYLGQIYIHLVV